MLEPDLITQWELYLESLTVKVDDSNALFTNMATFNFYAFRFFASRSFVHSYWAFDLNKN